MILQAYRGGDSTQKRPGWRIALEYDEDIIDRLKSAIPARDREWNQEGGYWWVSVEHEEQLCGIIGGFEAYLRQGKLFE